MRRYSQRQNLSTLSEINITPLLDLAFVLLIIFMITTPLLESSMNLVIPSSGATNPPIKSSQVQIVSIDRSETIRFNNQVIDLKALTARLTELKQRAKSRARTQLRWNHVGERQPQSRGRHQNPLRSQHPNRPAERLCWRKPPNHRRTPNRVRQRPQKTKPTQVMRKRRARELNRQPITARGRQVQRARASVMSATGRIRRGEQVVGRAHPNSAGMATCCMTAFTVRGSN